VLRACRAEGLTSLSLLLSAESSSFSSSSLMPGSFAGRGKAGSLSLPFAHSLKA